MDVFGSIDTVLRLDKAYIPSPPFLLPGWARMYHRITSVQYRYHSIILSQISRTSSQPNYTPANMDRVIYLATLLVRVWKSLLHFYIWRAGSFFGAETRRKPSSSQKELLQMERREIEALTSHTVCNQIHNASLSGKCPRERV